MSSEFQRDPWLACLTYLTRYFGDPVEAEVLTAGLALPEGRLTPVQLGDAAARARMNVRRQNLGLEDLSPLQLPAIASLRGGGACVLLERLSEGRMRILLPENGDEIEEIEDSELAKIYSGEAYLVRPRYRFHATPATESLARARHWVVEALYDNRWIYAQVLLATGMVNLFAVTIPIFIMTVYDRVVPHQATETLWVLAIGAALVFGFDFVLRGLRAYFIDAAGNRADIHLASRLFERVLSIRMEERPRSSGVLASRMRELEAIREFFTSATLATLGDIPFALFFIAVIAAVGGPVAWVPLAMLPLVIMVGALIQLPLDRAMRAGLDGNAERNAVLFEVLGGAEVVKTLGAEAWAQRNWERAVALGAAAGLKSRLLSSTAIHFVLLCQSLAVIGVVLVGVYQIRAGALSMGALIACVMLSSRALAPLAQTAQLLTRLHHARAAMSVLAPLMKAEVERPEDERFVRRRELAGDVELREVSFRYSDDAEPVLRDVSLRIAAGERVGILGKIGSGKSTLLRLMLGLYRPEQGSVRIGGVDLRQLDPLDLRRTIGAVPQETHLFTGTVRENVTLHQPQASDAEVLRAANLSGLDSWLNETQRGFDQPVGERGNALSGGQRQSIAIARGLLSHPSLILLDEPTSLMDGSSEQRFIDRLRAHLDTQTLVLVTHKPSMLSLVDRLLVVDGGRVVLDGPRDKVLERLQVPRPTPSGWAAVPVTGAQP